jgi:hypothetical protein
VNEPVVVFESPDQVDARLRSLGLTVSTLHRAIEGGEAERLTCTSFDPTNLAGYWRGHEPSVASVSNSSPKAGATRTCSGYPWSLVLVEGTL